MATGPVILTHFLPTLEWTSGRGKPDFYVAARDWMRHICAFNAQKFESKAEGGLPTAHIALGLEMGFYGSGRCF
jgi:hypothetical protein